jgi:hypothetical protein
MTDPSSLFFSYSQRLATRALRAADRESVRDRDDYALVSERSCVGSLTLPMFQGTKEITSPKS